MLKKLAEKAGSFMHKNGQTNSFNEATSHLVQVICNVLPNERHGVVGCLFGDGRSKGKNYRRKLISEYFERTAAEKKTVSGMTSFSRFYNDAAGRTQSASPFKESPRLGIS